MYVGETYLRACATTFASSPCFTRASIVLEMRVWQAAVSPYRSPRTKHRRSWWMRRIDFLGLMVESGEESEEMDSESLLMVRKVLKNIIMKLN